jgi:hypothetical protein
MTVGTLVIERSGTQIDFIAHDDLAVLLTGPNTTPDVLWVMVGSIGSYQGRVCFKVSNASPVPEDFFPDPPTRLPERQPIYPILQNRGMNR